MSASAGSPSSPGTRVGARVGAASTCGRGPTRTTGGTSIPVSRASSASSLHPSSSPSSSSPAATSASNAAQRSSGAYQIPVCTGCSPGTGATSGCG
ncbi:hypothetical protein OV079_09735 [Nannocystis pusilla]|uniref:Uncharacterized protein n=1 Tax=Nannocystis pusilla TaxID=889268 RepID=A0A9X3EKR2_9BACT|nr:hypothetical protein [Nannocystis pusilla]MCY1005842.1 hypothetical protein [Nannocystis pusilla]